jgi:hypothetical protein
VHSSVEGEPSSAVLDNPRNKPMTCNGAKALQANADAGSTPCFGFSPSVARMLIAHGGWQHIGAASEQWRPHTLLAHTRQRTPTEMQAGASHTAWEPLRSPATPGHTLALTRTSTHANKTKAPPHAGQPEGRQAGTATWALHPSATSNAPVKHIQLHHGTERESAHRRPCSWCALLIHLIQIIQPSHPTPSSQPSYPGQGRASPRMTP